jgi:anaerobic selenocysteine-containing dehydrogenase
LKQKVTEPSGEVKPETEIYYMLAKRLGLNDKEIAGNIPSPGDEHTNAWLNNIIKDFPDLTIEKLKQGPVLPNTHVPLPFSDNIFPTPSGKIELVSDQAEKLWGVNKLPDYEPIEKPDSFPVLLMTPNSKNRIHSQFGNLNILKQFEPEPLLYVNPCDAETRGVNNNDYVLLFNDVGTSKVRVCFDYGIYENSVVLTNGHWHSAGASPNLFTKGKFTDMGFGTAFHDTWVDYKKLI